ncbi:hypothetical protein CDL12_09780 [Handroanthus impetiginosus]|uniref:Rapid ALkalinization Factor n=1 Tax=Handroanthus impetiginosus TaxID=429701 RepID=A0A2G9HJ61_9LAMI|nr:hypothetical protein CDL12_09780 [Handroanthus impetiginosus]
MKKININQHNFLQLGVALALILVLLSAVAAAHAPAEAEFNATRIADWLPDDEEFLMESETNRRILQDGKQKTITYPAINPKEQFCDSNVYGSCIGNQAKIYTNRKCDSKNLCKRPGE